jgi:hypothetical protein
MFIILCRRLFFCSIRLKLPYSTTTDHLPLLPVFYHVNVKVSSSVMELSSLPLFA